MNIKKLSEKIKNELPKTDNELEFVRAVYINLGKDHYFDSKFYFGNSKTRADILEKANKASLDPKTHINHKKIICRSLSKIEQLIYKEYGYNVSIYGSSEGLHVFPVLELKDGRKIKIDLQNDLGNVQTGCKTKYFGAEADHDENLDNIISEISPEELKRIDQKIGYIKDDYQDKAISELREEIKDKSVEERLRMLLTDERTTKTIKENVGFCEITDYYKSLIKTFFTPREKSNRLYPIICRDKNIKIKEDVEPDEDLEKEPEEVKNNILGKNYTSCIFLEGRKKKPSQLYLYSHIYNRYLETDLHKMNQLMDQGLCIDETRRADGVEKLKKCLALERKQSLQEQKENNIERER